MISSRISPKGQITLPKRVRQALDLKTGERVLFLLDGQSVILRAMGPTSARELAGSLSRYAGGRATGPKVRALARQEVARAAAQEE